MFFIRGKYKIWKNIKTQVEFTLPKTVDKNKN
jgi:hypothetical protein